MIGSCINFWLARRYGETLAKAFVDDDTYNKYIGYLDKGKHFERIFFLGAGSSWIPRRLLMYGGRAQSYDL